MKDGDTIQVAHLVTDLEKAIHNYRRLGIGPWDVYDLKPPLLWDSFYRGRASDINYLIALTSYNSMQFELIQPVKGYSIFNEFLERHGGGFHHVKLYYKDCQQAVQEYAAKGFSIVQSGKIAQDEFYYLDTEPSLGVLFEIGNNGAIGPPDRVL